MLQVVWLYLQTSPLTEHFNVTVVKATDKPVLSIDSDFSDMSRIS